MTPRKQKALAALLTSPTIEQAAKAAGVGNTSLRRWLREDQEFKEAYQTELAQIVKGASALAKRCMSPALLTLLQVVEDETVATTARIAAARALLEHCPRVMETGDVLDRLEALEQEMEEF